MNKTKANSKSGSAEELMKSVDSAIEKIFGYFESDKYRQYLQTLSKFHDYSLNNTLLIAMQKPDATLVAGYTAWQKLFGRQVQKGENGIRILAPTPYKKRMEVEKTDPNTGEVLKNPDGTCAKEITEVLMPSFKVVSVFDVSQTDGKPLPSLGINELTGEVAQYEMFIDALKKTCSVPIGFEQIEGGAKGYYHTVENRIAVQEGMSQVQTIKTLIHEMAHQKLHLASPKDKADPSQTKLTRNGKEVEAESVAFTVCRHYGIDTGDYSFAYVAGWSKGKETPELKASLDKIRKAASEIITEIDGHLAELRRDYTWTHLTAEDVQNIEYTGSSYCASSRSSEHTFTCEIAGEPIRLNYETSHHDDGEGFVIHTEGKDIWEMMPESELRKLEVTLSSAVELHHFLDRVEKAETIDDMREIGWSISEDEKLFLLPDHRQQLYDAMNAKETALQHPKEAEKRDSVRASLHEKSDEAKTEPARKQKKKHPQRVLRKRRRKHDDVYR